MVRIKKILPVLFLLGTVTFAHSSEWFEKNRDLYAVFHRNVWAYIERANKEDSAGNLKDADSFLSRAERKVQDSKPFMGGNWPKGWPQDDKMHCNCLSMRHRMHICTGL